MPPSELTNSGIMEEQVDSPLTSRIPLDVSSLRVTVVAHFGRGVVIDFS